MKFARTAVLVLLVALALAAGTAKIMKMPQEVEFFHSAIGMSVMAVVVLGVVQVLSGVLLAFRKTRLQGAMLLDVTLLLSAVVIFMTGNIAFGLVSLVPVILTSLIIVDEMAARTRLRETQL